MPRILKPFALLIFTLGIGLPAGEPPAKPMLRMETGTHTGAISRIAVEGSGKVLATASEDKTLRLWDTATGGLLSTLRPPSGKGREGLLYACAFSPDGKTLATGGHTGWDWDQSDSIYLFDVASGHLKGRITGLPAASTRLVYAHDGRLVACMGSGGIRVFRPDGAEAFRDSDYGARSLGADFDGAGRLVTSSFDGYLRLYDAEGGLRSKVQVGGNPYAVRFAPDGAKVAVGFYSKTMLELRSGVDLTALGKPDLFKVKGDLRAVAWSLDGQTLYAGGSHQENGRPSILAWSKGGRGSGREISVGGTTVNDLATLPDGRLAWGGYGPAWGILGGASHSGSIGEFKDISLGLNTAGTRVSFAFSPGEQHPAVFDTTTRELQAGAAPEAQVPLTSATGVTFGGWRNTHNPILNGHPLTLEEFEISRSLALTPQGGFLLGTSSRLYAFDAQGQVHWKIYAPGDNAWAVNVSQNGALGVAAYGDGTIRWHRMSDGKELLAFFPHPDGRRWVAWTPSGYYDAAPGSEDLIGWQLNRGKDEAADFFPASRFRGQFYRPDIISKVLETLDEGTAIAAADNATGGGPRLASMDLVPPIVRVLTPAFGAKVDHGLVTVKALVNLPKDQTIDSVWATVDGRRVNARGLLIKEHEADGASYTLEVPIPAQDCTLSVFARSGTAVSEAASVHLAWAGAMTQAQTGGFVIQPKLYVLAVGISVYQNPEFKLDYPAKDARDFSFAMRLQKTRLYRDVEVRLLTDAEATRDALLGGLEWLEQQTTAKDVAVLFLAGHGINDPTGAYYFLPWNADPDRVKTTMVPSTEFQTTLAKLPGKVLLFLDSCHSGNVLKAKMRGAMDSNRFINELSSAENGVVVFSASTGRQSSLESKEWGNGAFTKAVIEGLSGKADFQHTGRVTLNMLDLYISERVKALTKGSQSPTTAKPTNVQDFPIAVIQ